MKRVFPASSGRPDNSWPAAKTVLGLILPGRVTSLGCFSPPVIPILKLMYGHSYCGNHVSKEGGLTSQTSKSDAKSCLCTRYPEKIADRIFRAFHRRPNSAGKMAKMVQDNLDGPKWSKILAPQHCPRCQFCCQLFFWDTLLMRVS